MRRLCHQPGRWHQNIFSLLICTSRRRCPLPITSVRYYPRNARSRKDDDLVVREFDQYGPDVNNRIEVDPNAELAETGEFLKAKIEQLEKELAVLKEGPFGPNSEFMRSLPPAEREKAFRALEDAGELDDENDMDLIDKAELDRMVDGEEEIDQDDDFAHPQSPKVTLRIPKLQKTYVRRFNESLAAASKHDANENHNLVLWKWYLRCRQHVHGFSTLIPEDVWELLWRSQELGMGRSMHLVMLSKDMLAAEVPLTGLQWITYIECLGSSGDMAAATAIWEERRPDLGPDPELADAFWSLGVRLYAELDRPSKAQEIAFQCLDYGSFAKPQILLPVISAWARMQSSSASRKAWACYLRLRSEFGVGITPADFEKVSTVLLKAGKADLALAVFKDMVLAARDASDDSQQVYEKALEHVVDLQSRAISEESINRVSLQALTILPRFLQNKYFYGSWIKKLIGNGEVDAAALVVELMYERGIKPDSRHMNGVIGAWLRDGSPASKPKAEKMAWSMIHARINFVKQREQTLLSGEQLKAHSESRRVPVFLQRHVPSANTETFSILLQYYIRRSEDHVAEHLTNTMTGPAMIPPNSYIMNHWLYASLRASHIQAVWNKFVSLTATIKPDLETFACLWDAGKVQYDQTKSAHGQDFPSARTLYTKMAKWLSELRPRGLKQAQEEFSRDVYSQIIRCFCLSSDLKGTLCALHGLRTLFNEYPDAATTRMIVLQVSRLLPPDPGHSPKGRRGLRRKVSKSTQAVSRVSAVIEELADRKTVLLIKDGIDPDEMSTEETNKVQLDIVSSFLVVILKRLVGRSGDVENEVRTVARNMEVDVDGVDFRCEELPDEE